MPKVTVVEERKDLYIVQTDEGICTLPRTAYFELKYANLDGNRIFHSWGDGVSVEETYNDGIFNAVHGPRRLQIADGDGIARAILDDNAAAYGAIFDRWYGVRAQEDAVKALLSPYGHRVEIAADGYTVDGMFRVDRRGNAYVLAASEPAARWEFLCIVVSIRGRNDLTGMAVHCGGYTVKVNDVTATIVCKLMFLLHPNMRDGVFRNQLPEPVRERLSRSR